MNVPKEVKDVVNVDDKERIRRIDRIFKWVDEEINGTRNDVMGLSRSNPRAMPFNMGKHIGLYSTREAIADLLGLPKTNYGCLHNGSCNMGPCVVNNAFKPIHCLIVPDMMGYCLWKECDEI